MKKKIAMLCCLVLALGTSMSAVVPVKADITDWMWLGPVFSGTEPFLGVNVVAYREGSTAQLAVVVDRSDPFVNLLNVSAVIVNFDWGINYTSTDVSLTNPVQLNANRTVASFTVAFTVPSTSVASNLIPHTYKMYVEYVNATTGPKRRVGTYTTVPNFGWPDFAPYFAVYSNDQADAQGLWQRADTYTEPTGNFSSAEARVLWEKGNAELSRGETAYLVGDFAGAKTNFQNAVNYYEQAYTAESIYSQDYRAAQTSYYDALANSANADALARAKQANATLDEAQAALKTADAAMVTADAALTNAYGWMAFGIGWILLGIGVIVYGFRRPKPPA